MKQEYNLEDVRVRSYVGLKNIVNLLLAVFYFWGVYLGARLKLRILVTKLYRKAKRFFQISVFYQYALADGIYRVLFNTKWGAYRAKKRGEGPPFQLLLPFVTI